MASSSAGPVAVVGAGAAGLAASFRLHQAGYQVRLFDRNDHLGGRIKTIQRQGYLVEEGPSLMGSGYASILGVARDAGFGSEIETAGGVLGFPGEDGAVHTIDTGRIVRDFLRTKLVSRRAKLGMVKIAYDLVKHRRQLDVEDLSRLGELDSMSAAEYGRSRMGQELFDFLGDPCVRVLVACPSADVSAADMLYALSTFATGRTLVGFRRGTQSYADHVGGLVDVQLSAEVQAVEEFSDQVRLTWRDRDSRDHTETFAGAILACDANTSSRLHTGLDSWRRTFLREEVAYSCVTVCLVAMSRAPADSTAFIFPPVKRFPRLLAIAQEHNKLPGRVPTGAGLVGIYPSSDWSRELWEEDDEVIAKTMIAAAEPLVPELGDAAEFTHIVRADPAIMQTRPGYWTRMREFRERSTALDNKIQLAGDYFCTGNVDTASAAGERAARDLRAKIGQSTVL